MTTTLASPDTAPAAPERRQKPARTNRSARSRRGISGWTILILLAAAAVLMVFPFWLALINAFKPSAEYIADGPIGIPTELDFTAIIDFWIGVNFNQKLLNSVILSGSVALIAATLSLLSAFAIGIGRIKGRVWILAVFMLAFTIPQEALVYPLFVLSRELNLYDSLVGVTIILAVLQSAFGTYMLASVLGSFPVEVLEAARLDGASRFQILRLIVLPLTRSTLAVLVTFFFIWTWNDFFLPLVLLPSAANQTVSVSLGALSGQYTSDPTALAAASMAGILPALIFFLLFQRTLMRGVNIGAIK
ncbi:raffinose/stachyose/melibiose transport system permease protein [Arthrobacter sp. V4I6]|uniref:carbohydrate ABC transporter permease n=1 Tax=unclassified Arthrobacter TaxID=235627 RepID=UPI0027811178|nr:MULTISPECIES: carbohydrate ABC transporter permease [unclassified Arthrobacter]MDQ0823302.1 raffinose/stachyose/melibiose transport system permease protein [Arthrobacter sp. V1I7]MDQ0852935.1 raffinose/stachyose/melibiose transport system permease protein [Arthrobacter sp. V4I6]